MVIRGYAYLMKLIVQLTFCPFTLFGALNFLANEFSKLFPPILSSMPLIDHPTYNTLIIINFQICFFFLQEKGMEVFSLSYNTSRFGSRFLLEIKPNQVVLVNDHLVFFISWCLYLITTPLPACLNHDPLSHDMKCHPF